MNMSPADLVVRAATAADAEPLRAIRNHWIAESHASFDEQPLAPGAVRDWIAGFASTGPHRLLVAERAGAVVGFASSQAYRAHPAFRHTVETSLYVAPGAAGGGIGSRLYDALFAAIAGEGLHRAVVGIALPNEASVRVHRRHGFREVGVFDEYAIKNGRFVSSVWMQRAF
ncbi:MAG: GNAT family N-acetyltransferase [Burkholderiaceae bacterium]